MAEPADEEARRDHRRREPRYHAIQDRIWLQWRWEGDLNGLSARLINVSRSGAMILAGVRFHEGLTIQVTLEDSSSDHMIEAVVLGLVAGNGGLYKIRLGFKAPCPDAFIQAAANGFEAWLMGSRSWV